MKRTKESLRDLQDIKHTNIWIIGVLEGVNSRIPEAEKLFSELEDKMLEITTEEKNKVKRMKRTEYSLRDHWGYIKHINIQIIGVPEEEERKKK